MIETLLEQWKAGQEQKRAIEAERWEQEKRWREEDRAARLEKEAEQDRMKAEKEKADQAARAAEGQTRAEDDRAREEEKQKNSELYSKLLDRHVEIAKRAATVSFLQVQCHEDTWSYIARHAFGVWQPQWTTSTAGEPGGPLPSDGEFTKDPNLPAGRIDKQRNGMQVVAVSGDNLATILDALFQHAYTGVLVGFRSGTEGWRTSTPLYRRLEEIVLELEKTDGYTPGMKFHIDVRVKDTVNAEE
ncbi:hypothetical protein [Streptomyces sp. NPDC001770]